MDSLNNSSESSSGNEEYDSRAADSISPFFNNQPTTTLPHHHQTTLSNFFDPLPYYFDPPQKPPNLDMFWPKTPRSDTNTTDLISFSPLIPPSLQSPTTPGQYISGTPTFPTTQALQEHIVGPQSSENLVSISASTDQNSNGNNPSGSSMVRNPKKRSRASRRAPTTVLTTDTTNFRAMVQEFTGIPAPPFTSSSRFPRTRIDLFGTGSTVSSTSNSSGNSYLLRPFPHKLLQPNTYPFVSCNNHSSNPTNSINYQMSCSSSPNYLNSQSPILNFQSFLTKYPVPDTSVPTSCEPCFEISTSAAESDQNPRPKTGVSDEFGLGHDRGNVNNVVVESGGFDHHQNMVSSSSPGGSALMLLSRGDQGGGDMNDNPLAPTANWVNGSGTGENIGNDQN